MRTAELARNRWVGILQSFGVADKFLRNKHGECPFCGGRDRYRFDNKNGLGTWICNQCGSGNGFDFLTRLTGENFKEIAQRIDKLAGKVPETKPRQEKDPSDYLRMIYKKSTTQLYGSPVERYLNKRGLDIENVTGIRYCAELTYFDDGKNLGVYPAMVCQFSDVSGNAVTYHVTYLTGDGCKADLPVNRKFIRGKSGLKGGAIRLSDPSKLLCVAEGVETALAVKALYKEPCWAVGNAVLLEGFEVPQGVEHVCIFADNDANYTGQKAAYTLANKLHMKGIKAVVYVPEVIGEDFNDVLMRAIHEKEKAGSNT